MFTSIIDLRRHVRSSSIFYDRNLYLVAELSQTKTSQMERSNFIDRLFCQQHILTLKKKGMKRMKKKKSIYLQISMDIVVVMNELQNSQNFVCKKDEFIFGKPLHFTFQFQHVCQCSSIIELKDHD